MQAGITKRLNQGGSVLIITLVLAIILGTTLASYLFWVRTQNLLVEESQAWNSALAIAEAGIEEGMAQINVNVGTVNSTSFGTSIAVNWTPVSEGWSNANVLGYSVLVSNDFPPTIYATGTSVVAVVGRPISRKVRCTTSTNSLFGVGITALQNIDMKGNNIYVDAYDSADLVKFPGGLWNSNNAFAGGDVATTGGIVSVGNANIHGRVILAPGASYNIGAQGLVGDMPANWPAQSGLQSEDWLITDFNKEFADAPVPFSSGMDPTTTGNSTNQYDLTAGNWFVSGDLTIGNNKTLYVRSGVVSLYVTGNVDGKANSTVIIASGATLKLYVGTPTGSAVSATFGQVNNMGNAQTFQFFGLPTCTSYSLSGNDTYVGTVYAPQCAFTLGGSGNNRYDYQGACVVYSVSMNGSFNFHYDVNLKRVGFPSGYTVASWKEL
jgi:hypothetical protein